MSSLSCTGLLSLLFASVASIAYVLFEFMFFSFMFFCLVNKICCNHVFVVIVPHDCILNRPRNGVIFGEHLA